MHHRMRITSITVTLLLVLCACAAPTIRHEFEITPGREFNASMRTALVVPLNETKEVDTGLEQGVETTAELIVTYLESKGLSVERPTMSEYRNAVGIAANNAHRDQLAGNSESVSERLSFSKVIPYLLNQLDSKAEIITTSNMVIRTARYHSTSRVEWDGVRRQERGTRGMSMTGTLPVASLFTVIYDRVGNKIFSAYGGLDLLFELNVSKKRYDIRNDRLQKPKNLAEGICVSFHPFFGWAEDC